MTSAIVITAAERDQLLARLRLLEELATPDPGMPAEPPVPEPPEPVD